MDFAKIINLYSICGGVIGAILIAYSTLTKLDGRTLLELASTKFNGNPDQVENLIDLKADTVTGIFVVVISAGLEVMRIIFNEKLSAYIPLIGFQFGFVLIASVLIVLVAYYRGEIRKYFKELVKVDNDTFLIKERFRSCLTIVWHINIGDSQANQLERMRTNLTTFYEQIYTLAEPYVTLNRFNIAESLDNIVRKFKIEIDEEELIIFVQILRGVEE